MNAKDLIYFADFRPRLDDKNMLVVHAATSTLYMEHASVSAVVDGIDTEVNVVPVINRRSMICYRKRNIHFLCEYQFTLKVSDKFKKAVIKVKFDSKYNDVECAYTVRGGNFRKLLTGTKDSIDEIKYDNDKIIVTGWCAAGLPVKVTIEGVADSKVTRVFRSDVYDYYQEGELRENAGFVIEVPKGGGKSFKLVMETAENRTVRNIMIDKEVEHKQYGLWRKIKLGIEYCRQRGLSVVIARFKQELADRREEKADNSDYDGWIRSRQADTDELDRQRRTHFGIQPVFSIIVPVYRPVKEYFEEMLLSIKNQTYPNWELCIADGSGDGFYMEESVKNIFGGDNRIKYKALSDNLGISENTNEALSLASGDYIVLADHDDIIMPDALFECAKVINENKDVDIIYTDEDKLDSDTGKRFYPHFKPDFDPYLLRSCNYITHLFVFTKELGEKAGKFNKEYDGSQDYDMILRCVENAHNIKHIPKVLYSWRSHANSTAQNYDNKNYACIAGMKALESHYQRIGIKAYVSNHTVPGYYYTTYELEENPLISIIIPNKDNIDDLDKCINSVIGQDYTNYEIIVVENNSTQETTFDYYKDLEKKYDCIKVLYYDGDFNFSKINNYAVGYANGEYLLFLNNDTEMIKGDCLRQLVSVGVRRDVGAVGARLLYGDNTVQHAGVIIGLAGVAGHAFAGLDAEDRGYFARDSIAQNYSAVTAACMLVRRSVYDEVGGLEEKLKVDFNDVDFCLKIREKNYLIVYNPLAELYHYESKSRGKNDTLEKHARYNSEIAYMVSKWAEFYEAGDPYYNPNLTLQVADFSLKE